MQYVSLFLLGFSSLFPLINPIGTAIIVDPYFSGLSEKARRAAVLQVCIYGMALGLGTLVAGSWCLKFMGVSVDVTQAAGGLIIARMGLALLDSEPKNGAKAKPTEQDTGSYSDALFYPIAFPLTLGPGGISALITLSAHAHVDSLEDTWFRIGILAISLAAIFVTVFICYSYSHRAIARIGPTGSMVVNRLSAFLVFCIGVQVAVAGFQSIFPTLLK